MDVRAWLDGCCSSAGSSGGVFEGILTSRSAWTTNEATIPLCGMVVESWLVLWACIIVIWVDDLYRG